MKNKQRQSNKAIHHKTTPADEGRAGASPPAPAAGGMGESVTPHKRITVQEPGDWRYRASNIDTLDLGLYVNWSGVWNDLFDRLNVAKQSARHSDGKVWTHSVAGDMLVLPSGSASGYFFRLKVPHYHYSLAAREKPGNTPNVLVSIGSRQLWERGVRESVRTATQLVEDLGGTVDRVQVSRCDLALDLWIDPGLTFEFLQTMRVSRSKRISQHSRDTALQTYYVGHGSKGNVQARIYYKFDQVLGNPERSWIIDIWGMEYMYKMWRIEFQLRRKFLQKMGIESVDDLLQKAGALWRHLTTDWLSFRLHDDSNTSRRTVHPWWQYVQECADQFGPDVDLQRPIKDDGLAALEWYVAHMAGCLASYAAIRGCPTVDGALVKLANEVEDYWRHPERDWDEEYKKRCLRADRQIVEVEDDDIPI